MQPNYAQMLSSTLPEILIVGTALLVLLADVSLLRPRPLKLRFTIAALLGTAGCCAAMAQLVMGHPAPQAVLVSGPVIVFVQATILCLSATALLLCVDAGVTEHVGEFVALVLLATAGMLLLVSTQNLIVLFVSLELLSVSLYALAGFDRKRPKTAEAALKYFLFGGVSAAFLLYGFSLLYGLSNSVELAQIAVTVQANPRSPLLLIALATTLTGFGFKVAAVPLHFWVPDVYQVTPAPVAGFIASASKVASFFALFVVLTIGFAPMAGSADWSHPVEGWVPVVAAMAVLSMLLGNLGALRQMSVRRMLGYSAIAHSGYMLLGVVAHSRQSLAALLYYLAAYGLGTLGAFSVVGLVERRAGSDALSEFDGLSRRSPVLAWSLFIFLLSQAGIPPLSGFFAKFLLFVAAVEAPNSGGRLLWLVVVAIAMSAVSLYYYLQVLKRAFMAEPQAEAPTLRGDAWTKTMVSVLALATLVLGCAPNLLLGWLVRAVQ